MTLPSSSNIAGLPTIIKPFFGDQHFYADRVATLGIGTHLHDFKTKEVTEALITATTDEKQIERARQAGEDIRKVSCPSLLCNSCEQFEETDHVRETISLRQEDGVATAIECIYRDLEYARSLVPAPTDTEKEIGGSSDHQDEDAGDIAASVAKDLDKADRLSAKEAKSEAGSIKSINSIKSKKEGRKSRKEGEMEGSPSSSSAASVQRAGGGAVADGSRAASSSDEGWEVMSRGSTTESHVSVSRGSSATRSRQESASASAGEGEEGDAGERQSKEGGPGLTAKVLSMLGKPISHTK